MTAGAALPGGFHWRIPARYNIAAVAVDDWAALEPDRTALIRYNADGTLTPISYGTLRDQADRLAHALRERGVRPGGRVALLLPQSSEVVAGHLAAYKLGAIAVPLAALFGVDALRHRFATSGATAILTDAAGMAKLAAIRTALPDLAVALCTDGPGAGCEGLAEATEAHAAPFDTAETGPDDPALMIFTSGTTGQPKGALHGHRVLAAHVAGLRYTHAPLPSPGDRFWTPSDWAWAGGLLNCLLPSLTLGIPVVFGPFRPFDPDAALALIAHAGVRNLFLPPTALRMMRSVRPHGRLGANLRSVGSAGESLGRETWEWGRSAFGIPVNEFYGQTECNYVLGSSTTLGIERPGAIGTALPGHTVALLGEDGAPVAPGEAGEIAVKRPDPAMFLGYWRDAEATAAKFRGDFMLTGDMATADADGYVRFLGRNDDVITSSGYRIGPAEIEDCLATHPAVALAAVVGRPDAMRTEVVAAFVQLRPEYAPSPALAEAIRLHVRERLSAAEYPREVTFVDEVPLTTTGKVIRRTFRGG